MKGFLHYFTLILLLGVQVALSSELINDECAIERQIAADFVFLIDTSGSMCNYIQKIRDGFSDFVTDLVNSGVGNARFAIVGFGGPPAIRLNFTSSANETVNALQALGCDTGGNEASLEAIRRVILNDLTVKNDKQYTPAPGQFPIRWNTSSVNFFLITDEDSDLPTGVNYISKEQLDEVNPAYIYVEPGWSGVDVKEFPNPTTTGSSKISYTTTVTTNGQTVIQTKIATVTKSPTLPARVGPAVPTLLPHFQAEIDETARLILESKVKVNILVKGNGNKNVDNVPDGWSRTNTNSLYKTICVNNGTSRGFNRTTVDCSAEDPYDTWTAMWQFGAPKAAVQDVDYKNFYPDATLANLIQHGLGNSLQAKVLSEEGYLRVFDSDAVTHPDLLQNLYSAAVEMVNICTKTLVFQTKFEFTGTTVSSTRTITSVSSSISVISFSTTNTIQLILSQTDINYISSTSTTDTTEILTTSTTFVAMATITAVDTEEYVINKTFETISLASDTSTVTEFGSSSIFKTTYETPKTTKTIIIPSIIVSIENTSTESLAYVTEEKSLTINETTSTTYVAKTTTTAVDTEEYVINKIFETVSTASETFTVDELVTSSIFETVFETPQITSTIVELSSIFSTTKESILTTKTSEFQKYETQTDIVNVFETVIHTNTLVNIETSTIETVVNDEDEPVSVNTSVIVGASLGALGVLGLASASAYYIHNRADAVDNFGFKTSDGDAAIADNPLYEHQDAFMSNNLYENIAHTSS